MLQKNKKSELLQKHLGIKNGEWIYRQLERIFDGLSLGAKERGFGADLVQKYEDSETKIHLPQVRIHE
ncbi:hypothetical protein MTR_3g452270 [Medicago truncatula]|uniref:Uncharacterized protein n=1 Tax=Medicago truncatula TaxID=3880 RepID=A0A072UV26_MEDTR|nr:hypothetical protein MTR_3g451170 [Medicago truncatula]KEH33757.1 hypothetical protein MTR_3g452270 [Medicago truncatula]